MSAKPANLLAKSEVHVNVNSRLDIPEGEQDALDHMKFACISWQSQRYREALDLRRRVLRSPLGLEFSNEDLEAEQFQTHYAAFVDDQLVACLTVEFQHDGGVKLRQMAVEPTRQRAGLGTFLMRQIENEMIRREVRVIKLHARKTAIGFYERLGFQADGEEFVEVTLPHVLMTKKLRR